MQTRAKAMTDIAVPLSATTPRPGDTRPKLDQPVNPLAGILFFGVIGVCVLFVAYSLYVDIKDSDTRVTTYLPFMLLFVALLIDLGFEFVNGFHDNANAVATVIYTHSFTSHFAFMWSGCFTFSSS